MSRSATKERLLAEALSHLAEGVLITNDRLEWPGPHIIFVNEAMCRITGYSASELIGQSPRILQGADTDRKTLDRIKAELSEGKPCRAELINYRKDGTRYDAALFITPLYDSEGSRTNYVSIHHDVSERKRTERELRESRERLRAVVETAVEAIITIDRHGTIWFFNRAAETMFGYSSDEVVGQNVSMLMPSPYRNEHSGYIDRYLRTGEATIIGTGREVTALRKNGSIFPIQLAVSEIDHLEMFTGIVRDISDRKEAEEALRREHELSEGLIQTAQCIVLLLDPDGRILRFNRYMEELAGWRLDEVEGKDWFTTFLPEHDRKSIGEIFQRALRGERTRGNVNPIITKDGGELLIEWYDASLTAADGAQIGLLCIGQDITDRIRIEKQLRQADRLSAIGTLAAGLGHDMNNILLPVRARLDRLEQVELSSDAREQFIEIRKLAKYLQDLADGLHLLALDPDDLQASNEITDLNRWWQQTHTLLGRALPKHVRFSASMPSDLPNIEIAPHRLTQAILNLLVNSAKAVDEMGRVRLWADANRNDGLVRLAVTDNGCGMTEEIRRRALEPFFTTKTRGLGTGLGLSLVQSVVLAAHGTIKIESEPRKGTTIILEFPAAARLSEEATDDAANAARAIVSVRDRRLESLVINLLEIAGLNILRGAPEDCESASIWVTDASHAAPESVSASVTRKCAVVILGPDAPHGKYPGALVVHNPNDFDTLQAAISEAAEGNLP